MPSRKRECPEMEEGARKKQRTSINDNDDEDSTIAQDMATMATASVEPLVAAADVAAPVLPSQDSQALQVLKGDFDDLRQLITCRICERLLYEPFVISCGHTYCYSCLCTWFATSRKKTCPNCRENITQPPAPSYVIKEMTHIFIRRHEQLPDGETIQQHEQWKEEEAEIVRKDKSENGGLFKGLFSGRSMTRLHAVHDPVDHVDRCPECNWEIEDGMCNNCGLHMDSDSSDFSDSDDMDDEEIEDDFEDEDAEADPAYGEFDGDFMSFLDQHQGHTIRLYDSDASEHSNASLHIHMQDRPRHQVNLFHHGPHADRFHHREAVVIDEDDENEDDDDDEDEGSLEDFIDDRDPQDITNYTIDSQPEEEPERRNRRAPRPMIIDSDDEVSEGSSSDHETHNRPAASRRAAANHIEISDDDGTSDTSDDEPILPSRTRTRHSHSRHRSRPQQRISISDSDDSEDSDDLRVTGTRVRVPTTTTSHRRRPHLQSDSEDLSGEDAHNRTDNDNGTDMSGHVEGSESEPEDMNDPRLYGYAYDHEGLSDVGREHEEFVSDGSDDENDNDEDGGISDENHGFSPMQSEDEEDQGGIVDGYDVYGAASDESGTE